MSSYIDLSYEKKVVAKIVALPQQIFDKKFFVCQLLYIFTYVILYAEFLMFLNTFDYFDVFNCPNIVTFAQNGVQMSKNPNFEKCRIFQFFSLFYIRSTFGLLYGYKLILISKGLYKASNEPNILLIKMFWLSIFAKILPYP